MAGEPAEFRPGQRITVETRLAVHMVGGTDSKRFPVGGRSRCSPADLTGTYLDGNEAWSSWAVSPCTAPIALGGDVSMEARSTRASQHPVAAASKHITAAMAMAGRGRDGVRAPPNITVPQLYQRADDWGRCNQPSCSARTAHFSSMRP